MSILKDNNRSVPDNNEKIEFFAVERQTPAKSKIQSKGMRRHKSNVETSRDRYRHRDDADTDNSLPGPIRDRLYELFGHIEREFEQLYATNASLQEQVEALSEKLGDINFAQANEKVGPDIPDAAEYSSKNKKTQLSQRIKSTYKQSTSKLVSSFRTPTTAYSVVREFKGHRDGVWEINVSKTGSQMLLGTASVDRTARLYR